MGRVVAIGGGDLTVDEAIHKYALGMIGSDSRNVLYVGTASKDDPVYFAYFESCFAKLGCTVKTLFFIARTYTDKEIRELTEWADVIYVCGGDTVFMLQEWKKLGFDNVLREVYNNDSAVLMGSSAGGICWFDAGCTDSELVPHPDGASCGWADEMLGVLPYSFCPHYDERLDDLELILKDKTMTTYAMYNDTAVVENNGKRNYLGCVPWAKAYLFSYGENGYEKTEVTLEMV